MATFLLDLIIVVAIAKELWVLSQSRLIPVELSTLAYLVLPFFLGVSGKQGFGAILLDPVRLLLRNGVAVISVLCFWQLLALQALRRAFWWYCFQAVVVYMIGRGVGWRLRLSLTPIVVALLWALMSFLLPRTG